MGDPPCGILERSANLQGLERTVGHRLGPVSLGLWGSEVQATREHEPDAARGNEAAGTI